ncbi:ZYRO0C11638p [Zygosaccharomyces rouxii]|uniref:ZYRO0C11638p n=1 Tax=Zygosaccharomyces rouxii (strain ATCC 2623 / CBS 732 / NBRC 1130 / NCYC 568 / NRRL Y-229) TaxID=559307 RepID=C5DTV6_ZYGRC|nr:uncharacterized protein ZYRO0C11638g [Zygosaccharomyces rouxii]KAH9201608.1 hypothetical protein LQ764DRAFT_81871 [Zygosaccharomyces rouxii]CAR27217.1 ZYRO0C11638p [Zygosaccharomyces rouxii]
MMLKPRNLTYASRILRSNSTLAPDNSPRAADNEQWLERLGTLKKTASKSKQQITHESSSLNRFPIEVVSTPPESPYIDVKAAIANFTSTKYLQGFNKQKHTQGNFVDIRIVKCRSGDGGDGIVSFFRDANRSVGPPNGGDGGDGGSVYVRASTGINSLAKLRTTYIADNGSNGAADQLDGARGKDILITVPVGTVVRWCLDPKDVRQYIVKEQQSNPGASLRDILNQNKISMHCSGRYEYDTKPRDIQLFRNAYEPGKGWLFKGKDEDYHQSKDWFVDLSKQVEDYDHALYDSELSNDKFPLYGLDLGVPTENPICLLKGGKGGLGNMHFLTNMIRNPRFAKAGRSGLECLFLFELKSIADLGLVGLPNAGKSTILNKISNAKPKIGHWEFTTLNPSIGTISPGIDKPSFTVADIPGIIENAAQDKGMGLEFLRHIERSKGWVFVISIANENPLEDFHILLQELGGMEKVGTKNVLVVCNKADIDHENPQSVNKFLQIRQFCDANGWDSVPISALKNENIDLLLDKMAKCAGKLV